MTSDDYDAVFDLWSRCTGIGLGTSDTRPAITAYLARNAGMSAVAVKDADAERDASARLPLGAVLCGHDGRRGTLHHLAVEPAHRRQGVARALVSWCITALADAGIDKCNIFLWRDNADGEGFWLREGWSTRPDIMLVQRFTRGVS
jgi:putative acetyltransferase